MTIQLYYGPWDPNNDPNFSWINPHGPVYQNPAISVTPAPLSTIDIRVYVRNHGAPAAQNVKIYLYAIDCALDPADPVAIADTLFTLLTSGTPLTPSPWNNQIVPAYSPLGSTEWVIPGMGKRRWPVPASGKYVILSKLEYTGSVAITPQIPTEGADFSTDPHVGVWIQF